MSLSIYAINSVWMLRCRSEWHRFLADSQRVASTQASLLKETVLRNQGSAFGKRHGFASIKSTEVYQRRLPLMQESELEAAVHSILEGTDQPLTTERVLLLQPTSGSTHATKLIPYTQSLRYEYQRMVAAWIGNLFWEVPQIRYGPAYWSISPACNVQQPIPSGISIGFDDDTAYLGIVEQWMARRVLAVPPSVAKETDIERFRYLTLLYLMRASELSLISIWSPTFLSGLLDQLLKHSESLIRDIHDGTLLRSHPDSAYFVLNKPNRHRANQLSSIFSNSKSDGTLSNRIWPKLALTSCWMDGSSTGLANRLQSQMAGVRFQAKGLLATEACISFPVVGQNGCALAIRSHFFEFFSFPPIDDQPYLAHQLIIGQQYTVVVTTGGGLYRYPLHDIIEITGKINECPLIRFVGRSNQTTDLVGEKLQEAFVQKCIDRVLKESNIIVTFAMLVAVSQSMIENDNEQSNCHYRFQIETDQPLLDAPNIALKLDNQLKENIHYRYARELGQLGPVVLQILPGPSGAAWSKYEQERISEQKVLGSIKPRALSYYFKRP